MPIGPRGEMLPYNGNGGPAMGGGPGPDLPPRGLPTQPGIDATNASMGVNRGGGDVMAAKQRLMQIAAEAEAILSQHPELAQEMMGGGPEAGPPVGGVGGIPQTPVAGNTGPPVGMPGLLA